VIYILDIAQKYEDQLRVLFANIAFDLKYQYLHDYTYREKYKSMESTWDGHEFVSIDNKGNIIGYFKYYIYRECNKVGSLMIVNFSDNQITFGKDFRQIVDDIFCKFNFNKLEYGVIIGNSIESTYDRLTEKYGGNIVGIYHKTTKLLDGKLYDSKSYEIFKEDYLRHMKYKNKS
jgi:hypothetical protein